VWVERDAPVLLVLGGRTGNADLARLPVHPFVLDQQHLAASATELECADEPVVQESTNASRRRTGTATTGGEWRIVWGIDTIATASFAPNRGVSNGVSRLPTPKPAIADTAPARTPTGRTNHSTELLVVRST